MSPPKVLTLLALLVPKVLSFIALQTHGILQPMPPPEVLTLLALLVQKYKYSRSMRRALLGGSDFTAVIRDKVLLYSIYSLYYYKSTKY